MTTDAKPDDSARISAIVAGALGVVFTLAGFAIGGTKTGLSIAVGAAIAVANLVTMRAIIGALLTPADDGAPDATNAPDRTAPKADDANGVAPRDPVAEAEAEGAAEAERDPDGAAAAAEADADDKKRGRRGGAAWGVFALLKILVLFGGIGLLLMRGWVEPIPLVLGYGVLPLGITASTLVASLRPKRRR